MLVSVIVPVYNEVGTIARVLDRILALDIPGVSFEVIVVESASTDGSREIVGTYASRGVACILEDRPRGKGHAVRRGLASAKGEILLIQDADLEYDVGDYPALLQPICAGRTDFVLGARSDAQRPWQLRRLDGRIRTAGYNLAHVLVTAYINLLFRLQLSDPQTMFKVFRRRCLEGLSLRGNYFDFDYEILLSLVRRGHRPQEVPVRYRSRTHKEGKKIRFWRDAVLGVAMITRMRLRPTRSLLGKGGAMR